MAPPLGGHLGKYRFPPSVFPGRKRTNGVKKGMVNMRVSVSRKFSFYVFFLALSACAVSGYALQSTNQYVQLDFKVLCGKAEIGDSAALCDLGSRYECGNGTETNVEKAVECYRKSAEQGYAEGQRKLGSMYARGIGVIQNFAEAFNWYRKAAEQGNAAAQNNLGWLYENGEGVDKNITEAVKW